MTQFEGFDEFEDALRRVDEIAVPFAEEGIGKALAAIHKRMSPYPAQPDRDRANPGNRPSPYNTYVRGIGHFPRSSFEQAGNSWIRKKKGAYRPGPRGGKVRRTSQQLQTKWRLKVDRQGAAVVGELKNEASYSGLVLGHREGYSGSDDGIPEQAAFHGETGWPNVDDGLAQAQPQIDQALERAVEQTIQKITGQ